MFRIQDNIPDIYINESRDFQLFCRLYDCTINGVKSDIDTIVNINVPFKANDQLLELLALKVGFITDKQIDSNLLRWIIASFPWALKFKGSIYGIKLAVNTISKYENIKKNPIIKIDKDQKIITINSHQLIKNTVALDEFLKYIMPSGYTYEINLIVSEQERLTITNPNEIVQFSVIPTNMSFDREDDYGYKKYTSIKVTVSYSEKSRESIYLTDNVTLKTGDYIGIGSIISTNANLFDPSISVDKQPDLIFVPKTVYYGTEEFEDLIGVTSISKGSLVVNSRINGVLTPTYHTYISEQVENELGMSYTQSENIIHYYVNPERKDDETNPIVMEYIIKVPELDIGRFKYTLNTTFVSDGLNNVYILTKSGEIPTAALANDYSLVYNEVDNKWWELDGGWKELTYLNKIDNTNKEI